ncbi:MAG: CrcB family protein [Bacteroidales bacterium]|nr:CrcB family protein [Bacteroidales bacterium]
MGTFTVNIIGSFVIGILFGLSEKGNIMSPEWRIFLTVGVCGGFATSSIRTK